MTIKLCRFGDTLIDYGDNQLYLDIPHSITRRPIDEHFGLSTPTTPTTDTSMETLYLKHWMLPIRDLSARYIIDHSQKQVRLFLQDHFDSALPIEGLMYFEDSLSVPVIVREHQHQLDRYSVTLSLAGVIFTVRCVQMSISIHGTQPQYTVSMKVRKES